MTSIDAQGLVSKKKRGEVRGDGMVYWAMMSGKERWITADAFQKRKDDDRQRYLANAEKIKAKLREKYAADPDKYKGKVMDRRYANIEKSRENEAKRREENRDKYRQWGKDWYKNNKEKSHAWAKAYGKKNPEKKLAYYKKWKANNMEHYLKMRRDRVAKRRSEEPLFAMKMRLRGRIWDALNRKGIKKTSSAFKILLCTGDEFLAHVASMFLPGMCFDNRGLWELDHIIPLSVADSEEQMIELGCYKNVQPLWAEDNLKKSNTIPENFEEILDSIAFVLKIPTQELKILNFTALVGSLVVREMS